MTDAAIANTAMNSAQQLVRVENLVKVYGASKAWFTKKFPPPAIDGVSFDIAEGETLALVGESGSGKSTTGRLVLQLEPVTSGSVWFEGKKLNGISSDGLKRVRRKMQVVFQDPYGALNPRMRVGDFVSEPWVVHGLYREPGLRRERAAALFQRVGLDARYMNRYPHEFSGGQRQRICIARAIALGPRFIVADEPITALDVSIQAQIMNLFQDLREELGIAYLFIAHDLSMVRSISHRVAVMFRGQIVEIGPTGEVFRDPQHAYTRALLSAIPIPDPDEERARVRIAFDADTELPPASSKLVEVSSCHFVLRDEHGH